MTPTAAPGATPWPWVLGAAAGAALLGGAFAAFSPALVAAVALLALAGAGVAALGLRRPVAGLIAVLAAQVTLPVYLKLPPGLPQVPVQLVVLAAAFGVGALALALARGLRPAGRTERALSGALLVYVAATAQSMVQPGDGASGVGAGSMFVKGVAIPAALFFLTVATLRTPRDVRAVFDGLFAVAALAGLLGLHEFLVSENLMVKLVAPQITEEEDFFVWLLVHGDLEDLPEGEIHRVYSFFTQPLEYAAFMIMLLPFGFIRLVEARSWAARLWYGGAGLAVFGGFAVTFSRGPTLALALTMLALAAVWRAARPWALAAAAGAALALAAAWPWLGPKLLQRLQGSENVSLRFRLWENATAIFLDNPLRGIGYGFYPSAHAETIRANRIGPMFEYPWPHIERVTTVESVYLTLALETGLVGLAAFALVLGCAAAAFARVWRHSPDPQARGLALAAAAGMLAYLLSGLTVANIVAYTITMFFFGVFLAALAALSRTVDPPRARAP